MVSCILGSRHSEDAPVMCWALTLAAWGVQDEWTVLGFTPLALFLRHRAKRLFRLPLSPLGREPLHLNAQDGRHVKNSRIRGQLYWTITLVCTCTDFHHIFRPLCFYLSDETRWQSGVPHSFISVKSKQKVWNHSRPPPWTTGSVLCPQGIQLHPFCSRTINTYLPEEGRSQTVTHQDNQLNFSSKV